MPCTAANLAAIFATVERPRRAGRGLESAERAAVDRVIAGLLFMAGLRRSEAAALEWRDVADAQGTTTRLLVAVRRGKTNPDGKTADVRYVKGDVARAIRMLRERRGAVAPTDRVVGLTAQAVVGQEGGVGLPAGSFLLVAGVAEMHLLHDAGEHEGGHLEVVELPARAEGVRDHPWSSRGGVKIDCPFLKCSIAVSVSM